ncbi:MAG TPA: GAF domain-containing protein [Anaerolineales bacterium]|nr:GAF domain-containing protein [Anaerolineales bacterium]
MRYLLPGSASINIASGLEGQDLAETQWREELITAVLRLGSLVGFFALIVVVAANGRQGRWDIVAVWGTGYLLFLSLTLFRALPFWLRTHSLLFILFGLALAILLVNGLSGVGVLFLFGFTLLTLLLMGPRAGLTALGISLTLMLGIGWLYSAKQIPTPANEAALSAEPLTWIVGTAIFLILAVAVVLAILLLQRNFAVTLMLEHRVRAELQLERERLEDRVAERTSSLERRTAQVSAGADIARIASTELDPDKLLQHVVDLIRARFNLYYVGVFVIDENNLFAVLKAGTGEAGRVMLERQHKLEIGGQSMIGRAVSERQARIALDVGKEAVRFNNPVLPLTHSEMALPLVARERAIGALTIQSDRPAAFSPEDILSLQGMADLIAVALDNARLFQEAQRALQEVTSVHKSYLSQAWTTFAHAHSEITDTVPTYTYANNIFARDDSTPLPGLAEAIAKQSRVVSAEDDAATLTIPITVRGQVIGAVAIETESAEHQWSADEVALVEAVIEQAALSLENARLIEEAETALAESRRLTAREQTVNTIGNKLRRLPDVESVLTTALIELGRTVGAGKGLVRLGSSAKPPAASNLEASRD